MRPGTSSPFEFDGADPLKQSSLSKRLELDAKREARRTIAIRVCIPNVDDWTIILLHSVAVPKRVKGEILNL